MMGILDKLKLHKDDANGTTAALKDQAASGMDKAGQMADEKTGDKFPGQIDTGVDKAKQMLGQETQEGAPEGSQAAEPTGEATAATEDTQEQPPTS